MRPILGRRVARSRCEQHHVRRERLGYALVPTGSADDDVEVAFTDPYGEDEPG